jgi:hypothetical protein
MPNSTEDTVDLMIRALKGRGVNPSSREEAMIALVHARFRTREIDQQLDAVLAGARIAGRVET